MSGSGNVLAFDFGTRRIGVAVGQALNRSATALKAINVRPTGPDWEQIGELVQTWEPEALVVGLPGYEDGSEHELASTIMRFTRQLAGRYHCPVHTIDERLSSREAEARQRQGQDADLDAIAAQVILETWWSTLRPSTQSETRTNG